MLWKNYMWSNLEHEIQSADSTVVAIVDDCDREGKTAHCRPGLTLRDFLNLLQEPRYFSGCPESTVDVRRICLSNLTIPMIVIMFSTVTDFELPFLSAFIRSHLGSQALACARLEPDGSRPYIFELHIPHFVLRAHRGPPRDSRTMGNGKTIRSGEDVTFLKNGLRKKENGLSMMMYSTTTSILIVGQFSRRWNGYLFTDSYYEAQSGDDSDESVGSANEDTVLAWDDERDFEGGRGLPDPFTCGDTQADTPLPNSRDYFINAASIRTRRVLEEWSLLVCFVEEQSDKHV
ncbi:hypothetical protein Micbo1qcDRAFT_227251 [Microdochium bolleyi]|uniref:Uncharacterized protein n=1 Tax=Microdochium bolleyi TaxID=196109 RepID=A0A136IZ15_9PEZI|nr:hypothetical protein Micbo1qcDRAFT_227251 [Microdochium bolleyi]